MTVVALFLFACGGQDAEPEAAESCGETEPGERLLRRLTHDEYRRTVRDLTGVTVDTPLASDEVVEGFRNDAHALVVDGLLADQYRTSAEAVGEAFEVADHLDCDRTARGDVACATAFVRDFGLRAFRRPLTDDDVSRYVELWAEVAASDGFDEGIGWVVTAMLQSPHFLYRSELGARGAPGRFVLTDWEMATALSYSLWGTLPDDALLEAAGRGELTSDDDIDAQIERMMDDPRALETVGRFVEAWLDLEPLGTVAREGLTPELREEMARATREQVAAWVADGGSLSDLLVDGGLLVEPSLLTTYARPDGSSPVHRGVLVRERFLCEELPPPPPNLDTSPPPVDPTKSTRERYRQHADDPACSGCHALIDPLGFAFEHYDQLGQWRDDDEGHPIDASGSLDGVPFVGADGLAEALVDDPRTRECFVYSWRRHVRGTHACGADPGPDVSLVGPLHEVLHTWGFRNRRGAYGEYDTFAVGLLPGEGEAVPPVEEPPGGVRFTIEVTSDWGGGYCTRGEVVNETERAVTWSGQWPVDGAIDNIWDAEVSEAGGAWTFTGRENNATLEPGRRTTFGFCASR